MKIFKVGQTVYYYLESDGIGRIVECKIKQVTKDLSTKKNNIRRRLRTRIWLAKTQ